jgi:hypothetical protein
MSSDLASSFSSIRRPASSASISSGVASTSSSRPGSDRSGTATSLGDSPSVLRTCSSSRETCSAAEPEDEGAGNRDEREVPGEQIPRPRRGVVERE